MQLVTTTARDPAQSAPAFSDIATEEQKRRMLPALRKMFEASQQRRTEQAASWDDGLAWSSLVLPYVESIWAAGDGALAAEVVRTIADRIYSSMDRRSVDGGKASSKRPGIGWPGVSCEIWGAHGAFGEEGYGWGAVRPAHIIRNMMGFRETGHPKRVSICPNLPASLAGPKKRYGIAGLRYGTERLNVYYQFADAQRLRLAGEWSGAVQVVSVREGGERPVDVTRTGKRWEFETLNHHRYLVMLG
jgi:hypothetical protein